MKQRVLLMFSFLLFFLVGCEKEKKETFPDLQLGAQEMTVPTEESIELKIISGSGEYTVVENSTTACAKVTIEKDRLLITGQTDGESQFIITDLKTHQTAMLKVSVSSEKQWVLSKAEVLDIVKKARNKQETFSTTDFITYWGGEVQQVVPLKIRTHKDSMYVFQAENAEERYKIEWKESELYFYGKDGKAQRVGNKKDAGKTLQIDLSFYNAVSRDENRQVYISGYNYGTADYVSRLPISEKIEAHVSCIYQKN